MIALFVLFVGLEQHSVSLFGFMVLLLKDFNNIGSKVGDDCSSDGSIGDVYTWIHPEESEGDVNSRKMF